MEKEKMTKLEKQWVLYDVGNSAFVMLVSTIIPIYFKNMATASGISAANSTAYGKDVGISDSSMLLALMFVLGFITFRLQRSGSFYGRGKTSAFPMLGRKPL